MKLFSRLCILVIGFTAYSLGNRSGDDMQNYYNHLHSHPKEAAHYMHARTQLMRAFNTDLSKREYEFMVDNMSLTLSRGWASKNTLFVRIVPAIPGELSDEQRSLLKALGTDSMLGHTDESGNIIEDVNFEILGK